MMARDWKTHPPKNRDDAFAFAEHLAQGACDEVFTTTGERPRVERRASSVVVVWPDGEVTNEIEIEMMQ